MNAILHHLRKLVAIEEAGNASDGDLLRRFVEARDEAAFCALLERHGPMVLAVCRRTLRHEADAEDALQATFLVLVRKAASVRRADSLRSYLYGVASRIASKARRSLALRRQRERLVADVAAPETPLPELQAILDDELSRLPEKYRSVLLACCLQGKSRDEAALELGCKPGAVKIRLERGRELLRSRLARRGVALAAVLVAAQARAVPVRLVAALARACARHAAGEPLSALTSATVAALVESAVPRLGGRLLVALLLLFGTIGAAASAVAGASKPEEPRPAEVVRRPEPARPERGPTLSVALRAVGDETLTVRVKEVNHTYALRPEARVWIDGRPARVGELKAGGRLRVTLSPDEGEIVEVVAAGPVVTCALREADPKARTIAVVWKAGDARTALRTFAVRAEVEWADWEPGEVVRLHLSADQKSVHEIERRSKR